jgi:hypothetical protein
MGETPLKIEVEQIDDKLEMISGTFPGVRFNDLATAMETRYGKPTSSKLVVYQSGYSAKFEYPQHTRVGKNIQISIEQAPLPGEIRWGCLGILQANTLRAS